MELKHIELANLSVSAANMRAKGAKPDIANILPRSGRVACWCR